MPEFQPIRVLCECTGVDLVHPPDRQPPGKFPFLKNARSVQEGGITSRPGFGAPLNPAPFDQIDVHSVRRMNNENPNASPSFRRFVGAGAKLFSVDAGLIDTGYSANPLSLIPWRPDQSTEPWLYVGDSNKMRKVRMDTTVQTNYRIGIVPPTAAPFVQGGVPLYTIVSEFTSAGGWANGGTAGTITEVARDPAPHDTIVGLLDFNVDPGFGSIGWCNISPANAASDFSWIGVGSRLLIGDGGGTAETVTVTEVHTRLSSSTILAIDYDTPGGPGLATIQATDPLLGLSRNSMVQLEGGEIPYVLSVTIGPDGLYSFRVFCDDVHVAGDTVVGIACFRAYLANAGHVAGETITAASIKSTIATGIGTLTLSTNLDLSKAGARPMSPEDYLHVSIRVDTPANLSEGRLLVDVDSTTNNFTQNLYYLPFRPADSTPALVGTLTSLQALQTAAQNLLIGEVEANVPTPGFANSTDPQIGSGASAVVPDSEQLFAGNQAWTELLIPYSALQRVGSDSTRSLANVKAIQIYFNCTGSINVQVSAWWVGGTFGPDTAPPTAQPLLYRYRYRSTLTGAKSQQSPATRALVQAQTDGTITGISNGAISFRQEVLVYPFLSFDLQVDQIDIERFGGVLNEWHYVGTVPNNGSPIFHDSYSDEEIKTNPPLEIDAVLPFPSFDDPITGTVNVIGTAVRWVSGPKFNVTWAPGQEILIGGVAYIVYGQPVSNVLLYTVQNVGVLVAATFLVAEPVLTGEPMAFIIGPFADNFLLSWGDPRNPGTIRATKGNDPDSAPIEYFLELCSPSEPIIGGVIYDNNAVVASNKRFWRIGIDANALAAGRGNILTKEELNVGHGLFAPWAICAGPAIFFLGDDGVPYETQGALANSLIEDDIRPLFPRDGVAGAITNGIYPPDLTITNRLRFGYVQNKLRFDFQNTNAQQFCLLYDPLRKGWWPWIYEAVEMNFAYWEEGESLLSELLLGQDGNVYQVSGAGDNGANIDVQIQFPYVNSGQSRSQKFYGDLMVDADPAGAGTVTIQQKFDLGAVSRAAQQLQGNGRKEFPLDTFGGQGQLAFNVGALVEWSSSSAAPTIYEWQPFAYDTGTVLRTSWASIPTSHGFRGWQHIREGYLPILMPQIGTLSLIVIVDGVALPAFTFTPTVAGQLQKIRFDAVPNKGLLYEYQIAPSSVPFLIFEKDLEIEAKPWGSPGPYALLRPFGDGFGIQ